MRVWKLVVPVLLMARAAQAEVVSEVTGNWAAPENDGYFYRAVLSDEGQGLRLRIWQGMSPDAIDDDPQFDNTGIIGLRGGETVDRAWLEVGATGELILTETSAVENYLYTERLTIRMLDNQFTAVAYLWSNDWGGGAAPGAFGCLSEACYACEADLWNGTAKAGDEVVAVPEHDFEALNASWWSPVRAVELVFCPGPD